MTINSVFCWGMHMELKGFKLTFLAIIEQNFKSACVICWQSCRMNIINDVVIAILVSLAFELKFFCYD